MWSEVYASVRVHLKGSVMQATGIAPLAEQPMAIPGPLTWSATIGFIGALVVPWRTWRVLSCRAFRVRQPSHGRMVNR